MNFIKSKENAVLETPQLPSPILQGILKKYIYSTIFLLLILSNTFGQNLGIDSDANPIYTFYDLNANRLEFTSKEPLSFTQSFSNYHHKFRDKANGEETITKYSGYLLKGSLINSGKTFNIGELDDLNLGISLELGYQRTMKSLKALKKTPEGAFTIGGNIFFKFDNIDLYDTDVNEELNKYPITFGLKFNYNYFFKNSKSLISFNAVASRGWNEQELSNYQDLDNAIITPKIVVLEKFKGKYGVLDNEIEKLIVSLSIPFYVKYINPIPFINWTTQKNTSSSYRVGILINILSAPLNKLDYTPPSTIGIGINKIYRKGEWEPLQLYVSGAIKIGKYK